MKDELNNESNVSGAQALFYLVMMITGIGILVVGFPYLEETRDMVAEETRIANATQIAQVSHAPAEIVCYQYASGVTDSETEIENSIISALMDTSLYPLANENQRGDLATVFGFSEHILNAQCVWVKVNATELRINVEVMRGDRKVLITEDEFVRVGNKQNYIRYVNHTLPDLVNQSVGALWGGSDNTLPTASSCLSNQSFNIHNRECSVQ